MENIKENTDLANYVKQLGQRIARLCTQDGIKHPTPDQINAYIPVAHQQLQNFIVEMSTTETDRAKLAYDVLINQIYYKARSKAEIIRGNDRLQELLDSKQIKQARELLEGK